MLNPWRDLVTTQFQHSITAPTDFFTANADLVSHCCFEMAKRFQRGGRLLVFGSGSSATDAQHVSVEFVHPVIVGKRALPAIALTNDIGSVLGLAQQLGVNEIFARQIQLLGAPDDIAMGLTLDGGDESVLRGLSTAQAQGILTIGMCGMGGGKMASDTNLAFTFNIPSHNPHIVQEIQETTYHILWETVHIFFEHKGLL